MFFINYFYLFYFSLVIYCYKINKKKEMGGSHADELYKYKFECPCPAEGCKNKNEIYWVHAGCGGHEKMNDWGYIRCDICYTKGLICEWRFNCGEHNDGYRSVSGQKLLYVLSVLGQMNGIDGITVDNIYENYKSEKKRFNL